MSHTLHHFRKDARYLLPKWIPWLVLLAVDLGVNLEWIFPLQPDQYPPPWLELIGVATWIIAAWLILSHPPEDIPASHDRFLATRPVSARDYWLARGWVLMLFIVLPLALQQALYLLLSHRPWLEVLGSGGYRGFVATAAFGWTLPFSALWSRREWGWGLGASLLAIWATVRAAEILSSREAIFIHIPYPRLSATSPFFYLLSLLAGLLMAGIAYRFAARRSSLRCRTALVASLAAAFTAAAIAWQNHQPAPAPLAPQEAAAISAGVTLRTPPHGVTLEYVNDSEPPPVRVTPEPEVRGMPPDAFVVPQLIQAQISQGGRQLQVESKISPTSLSSNFLDHAGSMAAMAPLFPAGTLYSTTDPTSVQTGNTWHGGITFASLADKVKPLAIHAQYRLQWWKLQKPVDMRLQPGALSSTADTRWEILAVRLHEDAAGQPSQGAVTAEYRVEWRDLPSLHDEPGMELVLYSPDRQTVWSRPSAFYRRNDRGERQGWRRRVTKICWKHILTYADGSKTSADPDNLRFCAIEARYLGPTEWTWSPDPIIPGRHLSIDDETNQYVPFDKDELVYPGRRLAGFSTRVDSLKKVGASSSAPEVMSYLCDVMTAAKVTKVFSSNGEGAQRRDAALQVAARDHLELMLDLPEGAFPTSFVSKMLREEHKSMVIQRLRTKPWLASILRLRQWGQDALPELRALADTDQPIPWEPMLLMCTLDDDWACDRLIEEAERFPERCSILVSQAAWRKRADLRDRIRALAEGKWQQVNPLANGFRNHKPTLLAIMYGNPSALELGLKLAAQNGGWYGLDDLLPLLNLPPSKPELSSEEAWTAYRDLKPADFRYLPEQLSWQMLIP